MRRWVLASASPRRRDLLELLGHAFEVEAAEIDESPLPGEAPTQLVSRLARAKATSIAARHPGSVVIGADTVVAVDGRILGKPTGAADAVSMLDLIAGRSHSVSTGVAVLAGGRAYSAAAETTVAIAPMTAAEIDDYVATGEPLDKAGAYGIQGIGGRFVERIDGSYHNVVGLPLTLLVRLLREAAEPI
ncbi:MAG: septum formation inhibitor Maf [Microthrixaceae bacterium]|nr:septum formation inhibitor Maf [Microthrixaceae bacterium]